jgi:ribosome biogenesis protein NSA1
MRFITGDECGLLKECIPEKAAVKEQSSDVVSPSSVVKEEGIRRINANGRAANRKQGVVALAWTQPADDEQFAALRINGTVELWQRSQTEERDFGGYLQVTELKHVFDQESNADTTIHPSTHPLGMASYQANDKMQLCACNAAGSVVILNPTRQESVVQRFSVYKPPNSTTTTSAATTTADPKAAAATAFALDSVHHRVAVGGRDRETVLFDTETAKQVWKAKNLPPDPQTLLQPLVWPTALQFLNDCSLGSNIMAAGTAHCQVRLYDVRLDATQRRPICWTPVGLLDHRVTTLCSLSDNLLVAGDSAGYLHTLDLRKLGRPVKTDTSVQMAGRYVGPAGSVRGLVQHPTAKCMAAVGLDRMLRIYDTDKRRQTNCMYLRQRVNCVLVGQDAQWVETDATVEPVMLDNEGRDQDDIVRDFVDSDDEEEDADESSGEGSVVEDIDGTPKEEKEASDSDHGSSEAAEEEETEEEKKSSEDSSDDDDDDDDEGVVEDKPFAKKGRPQKKQRR